AGFGRAPIVGVSGGRTPSADTSACARASVAPGASRPKTTPSGPGLRSIPSAAPTRSGTQYWKLNGNWKPAGTGRAGPEPPPAGPVLRTIPSAAPSRSGTQYWKLNGNWKPSGITPTTV